MISIYIEPVQSSLVIEKKEEKFDYKSLLIPNRMRSSYWKYFGFPSKDGRTYITRKKIVCSICNTILTYSKNTSNLRSHLIWKHRGIMDKNDLGRPKNKFENSYVEDSPNLKTKLVNIIPPNLPNMLHKPFTTDLLIEELQFEPGEIPEPNEADNFIIIDENSCISSNEGEKVNHYNEMQPEIFNIISSDNSMVNENDVYTDNETDSELIKSSAVIQREVNIKYKTLITPNKIRSSYWKYFGLPSADGRTYLTTQKVVCTICYTQIAYSKNTSNLKYHLISKHRDIIEKNNLLFQPKNKHKKRYKDEQLNLDTEVLTRRLSSISHEILESNEIEIDNTIIMDDENSYISRYISSDLADEVNQYDATISEAERSKHDEIEAHKEIDYEDNIEENFDEQFVNDSNLNSLKNNDNQRFSVNSPSTDPIIERFEKQDHKSNQNNSHTSLYQIHKENDSKSSILQREDEFELFGKSIAAQLKNMPPYNAFVCQEKIQSVITQERISVIIQSSKIIEHPS